MAFSVEIVVPGPWWNSLTYISDHHIDAGVRLRVPLGRGNRVGFSTGCSKPLEHPVGLKHVGEILDTKPVLDDEMWSLACWIGNTFLCGLGEALLLINPPLLLQGAALPCKSSFVSSRKLFKETSIYTPVDSERFSFYKERLSSERRSLVLFPEVDSAKFFFSTLPPNLKSNALLWPSTGGKKLWDAWQKTYSGETNLVVGCGSAVFAPALFEEVIIDDEANSSYIFVRSPRISARSIAGKRAVNLKASLVLGGRLPSAKTFLRSSPLCEALPKREHFIFVDITRSLKTEVHGIEGHLPITPALLERTRTTLAKGYHALWIMDRKGQSGEVYCNDCGEAFTCPQCFSLMRSEQKGKILNCIKCGFREPLPDKCPSCKGVLLQGKRPGLEALYAAAKYYIKNFPVFPYEEVKRLSTPSLVLGTRKTLALCDSPNLGLIAWLDLDAETRKVEYNARFQTFSMVWESYWRGIEKNSDRFVLIQSRRASGGWQKIFFQGWQPFWKEELQERKKLDLPPFGLLVQMDLPYAGEREAFIRLLEDKKFFVMDSGDECSPIWTTVKSTEELRLALAPRFEIKHSRKGFPVITLWTE